MLVAVERFDPECTSDFNQAEEYLGQVLVGAMPGFVLDAAGVTRSYLVERFTPVALDHNFMFLGPDDQVTVSESGVLGENTEPERSTVELGLRDSRPHFDFPPQPTASLVSLVNFHLTTQGAARGSFYELDPAFAARGRAALPKDSIAGILEGKVDPTVIMPRYFSTVLTAGRLVVFRSGGRSPLIHHFETLEAPRNSFVMRAMNRAGLY